MPLPHIRPLERKLHLASLELTGPRIAVRRGKDGQINLNFEDDLVKGTCITHNGEIVNEKLKEVVK